MCVCSFDSIERRRRLRVRGYIPTPHSYTVPRFQFKAICLYFRTFFCVCVCVCVCVFCVWSGGGLLTCHEFGKFQFLSFLEFSSSKNDECEFYGSIDNRADIFVVCVLLLLFSLSLSLCCPHHSHK